jgi:ATP-dependent RNA circularization protein (DNA/RNA ligase family)
MKDSFHKFPHTSHLLWLGGDAPREDKILSQAGAEEFLSGPVVVEEKVDGANLGLSVGPDGRIRAQNRGNYLAPGRSHAQWNLLWPWLLKNQNDLIANLGEHRILFGEWCYAKHSIAYDALPDWFLAFDVLELTTGVFWSSDRRNVFASELGMAVVPEIFHGRLNLNGLQILIGKSSLGKAPMEGIYLRREADGRLFARAKVVGRDFNQQIEVHWTRRSLVANRLGSRVSAST